MLNIPAITELALITAMYWVVDRVIHGDGYHRLLSRFANSSTSLLLWCIPWTILSIFCPWSSLPQGDAIRVVAMTISIMLAWKATTADIDIVVGEAHAPQRLLLLASVIATWFSPAPLLINLYLLTRPFAVWEHHATLPMRVLQSISSFALLAGTTPMISGETELFQTSRVLFFFLVTMQVAHYLMTALAKMWLGPRWYSWVTDNRVHHLAATAYSWGWARFIPWPWWRRLIGIIKVFEKPMQAYAFTIELLSPLALLHVYAGIGFSIAWASFHVGVFSVSGLLFWEWIGTNLVIAAALWMLPQNVATQIFGGGSLLIAAIFMILFPLRHKLYKPMPLGWWDTPFTQRMHWRVLGESGTMYGVYNNFMCPHERLFGKVHACFLAPAKGITYHLGEVWKHDLRDAIRAAGPNPDKLDEVRDRFGVEPRDEKMAANHVAYLKRFFDAVNRQHPKQVLPKWLRWLKAPGDQLFYWGELPPYSGQEPVTQVTLLYREEYFDGETLQRLRDEVILTIDIDDTCAAIECIPEPTPKEIDDLLLSVANGKIIDLPEFGGGYIHGDDGKIQ